ncbi:amino acid-binding protein [Aureimonas endophytica]|uniref:Amino acid-binding protein n=1 Tax=Aureimonas endophytica TaxID=2027858 RepID=A0A916ZDN4_9HYPH|nr:ABC transporter substrate-binding protein [Aureimonas endophytica]GGD90958.1 amino acid-binding protein [Aureimonas endophytica]
MTVPRALLASLLLATQVQAAEPPRIGVAAPLSGPNAVLGTQLREGARLAARSRAALVEADTACTAEGGRNAANRFVAEKVGIVVGFLCTEALEAALPILRQAGIATLDVGVRADRFTAKRRKTGDLVWRLAPSSHAEADALASLVAARWRDLPFGILDDGSVYARDLADALRQKLEAGGLKPFALDTYRPAEEKQFGLARRLARTGVTHFVVLGERADAAVIARDAAANGQALQLLGGESLLDEPNEAAELPVDTLATAPQDRFPGLTRGVGTDNVERQGYFGPAFAATEIAIAAASNGQPPATALNAERFATGLGPVRFDANGDGDLALFRTFRFNGRDFREETGG